MKLNFLTLFLFTGTLALAQEPVLTSQQQQEAIDSLAKKMEDFYVFPDKGKAMADLVRTNYKNGKYKSITQAALFSAEITKDLQSINQDLHINFNYSPERVAALKARQNGPEPSLAELKADGGKDNFGFEEVKILPGNIGYIKLNGFVDAAIGGDAAAAAMDFVAYTNAIIFDLRDNGGGSPGMIQLLTSYLYNDFDKIHLNNFYYRPMNKIDQTWTLPYVPGKRNPKAQVYVLTSNYTFSAAEEFTYNLRNLKRGLVIGEITGGGAHPGGLHTCGNEFVCFIPDGRAINPITNTNWEGVGVIPHVKVNKEDALNKAHQKALDSLLKQSTDEHEKLAYQWQLDVLQAKLNPFTPDANQQKMQVGTYGPRKIFTENKTMYYQREGRPKCKLIPIANNVYMVDGIDLKVNFVLKDKTYTAIEVMYMDGRKEINARLAK